LAIETYSRFMYRVFFQKKTVSLFGAFVVVAIVAAFASRIFVLGSVSIGFPFVFYEFRSGPPPYYGGTFSWSLLLLNICCYYLFSVFVICVIESITKAGSRGKKADPTRGAKGKCD